MTHDHSTAPAQPIDVVALCRELVQIPSFTGSEQAVADAVTARLLSLDFDEVTRDEFGSVIAVRHGSSAGPSLFLDGHMDVVPVESPERWDHAPFGGEIYGGRLWGRGSADTKGALAAMICAAAGLPRAAFGGRLVLAASVCEENITGAAVTPLLKHYAPDIFVTGEPTSLRLATAQKGRAQFSLHAAGRAAHTSNPQVGENAVYKMMEAVQRLRALPLPVDEQLGPSFLELTEIISEPYPNGAVVPPGCRARFIERILPGETRASVLERINAALNGLPGMETRLVELNQYSYTGRKLVMEDFIAGWRTPPDDPLTEHIRARLAAAGLPAATFGFPGGTNASAAGGCGIRSYIYGPGALEQAHTVDEWVAVDELRAAEQGFREIIQACCRDQDIR